MFWDKFLRVFDFCNNVEDAFSGLIHFSAAESPLKMMKNAFFHLKSSFRSQDI